MTAPEVLTVPEVAKILGVNSQTLYKQIWAGTAPIKPFKVGAQWRFSRYQVDQLLGRED